MEFISGISLAITLMLCVLGVFHPKYNDNIFQTLGMFLIFIGTWPRLVSLVETHSLVANLVVIEAATILHLGLAVFGLGTAYKVWINRRKTNSTWHEPERRKT